MSCFTWRVQTCRCPEGGQECWLVGGSHHGKGGQGLHLSTEPKGAHRQRFYTQQISWATVQDPGGSSPSSGIAVAAPVKPSHRFWDIPRWAQITSSISCASGSGSGSELTLIIKFYGFNIKNAQVSFCCPQTCVTTVICTVFHLNIMYCLMGNKQIA